ncbi:MAG: TolC family protein [Acidobacteriaceae bacterium]
MKQPILTTVVSLACIALAGCASYHPQPLPSVPNLTRTPSLTVPAAQFQLPHLAPHPIPTNGLDQTTIVTLAVYNDPVLKAARLQDGIARAQMLQAGLLPDPVFTAGFATSARDYGGALGLAEDLQSLITRGAAKAAASKAEQQVHLNILWQEWQVAAQASQLFLQARSNQVLQHVIRQRVHLLNRQYQSDRTAMQRGDQTSTIVSSDLSQLLTAQDQLRNLQTTSSATWHQLDQLLALQPGTRLHLIGPAAQHAITATQYRAAIAALADRRADLLALRAGYQSRQQALRESILAQFPNITAGVRLSRDPVEGVNSFGPRISLTLPIFNRNRGQIAIQRATRAYLRQTYQAHLDTAVNQAHQLWQANQILAAQLRNLRAQLPQLRRQADAARRSVEQDQLDSAAYTSLQSIYLTKLAESIQLSASLNASRAALRILLGLPLDLPPQI